MAAPIKVSITSDIVCPWCWVGKKSFEKGLAAHLAKNPGSKVEVEWKPFRLNPNATNGRDKMQVYKDKFGEEFVENWMKSNPIRPRAQALGISIEMIPGSKTSNTIDGHRLLHYALREGGWEVQNRVQEALFRKYFAEGLDNGDANVLLDAGVEGGLDAEKVKAYLAGDDDREEVATAANSASASGISGVPFFQFKGSRRVLSGAQDPPTFEAVLDEIARQQQSKV